MSEFFPREVDGRVTAVSSCAAMTRSSNGIGYTNKWLIKKRSVTDERTCPSVHLVLLMLALLLDHQQRVIKQEHLKISTIALCTTTFLQRAFVHQFTSLLLKPQILSKNRAQSPLPAQIKTENTYDSFARTEYELLIQLQQVEPILRLATLEVNLSQELANNLDRLGNNGLVWIVIGRILQYNPKQEWITC